MEQAAQKIKQNLNQTIKIIGDYLCWFLTRANLKMKEFLGEENYRMVSQFFEKHTFACIFGSMVMTACVFHVRHRNKVLSESALSSDHSKSKKSSPQKLPEKLKNKFKFISEDEEYENNRQYENLTTEPYESNLQGKKQRGKTVQKKKKDNYEDLEQALDEEVSKSRGKIILEDSKSDKIFNEMYGMYQEALR